MPFTTNSPATYEHDNDGDLSPRPLDEIFAAQPMLPPPLPPLEPLELTSIWDSDMILKFHMMKMEDQSGAVATAKVSGMSTMPQRPLVMSRVL